MNRAATDGRFAGDDVTSDGATIAGCSAKGATEPRERGVEGSNPSRSTILSTCDGCGARVPVEELSLVTFTGLESFACEECKRDTVVVGL